MILFFFVTNINHCFLQKSPKIYQKKKKNKTSPCTWNIFCFSSFTHPLKYFHNDSHDIKRLRSEQNNCQHGTEVNPSMDSTFYDPIFSLTFLTDSQDLHFPVPVLPHAPHWNMQRLRSKIKTKGKCNCGMCGTHGRWMWHEGIMKIPTLSFINYQLALTWLFEMVTGNVFITLTLSFQLILLDN